MTGCSGGHIHCRPAWGHPAKPWCWFYFKIAHRFLLRQWIYSNLLLGERVLTWYCCNSFLSITWLVWSPSQQKSIPAVKNPKKQLLLSKCNSGKLGRLEEGLERHPTKRWSWSSYFSETPPSGLREEATPGYEPQWHFSVHFPAGWPRAGDFASLHLGFLV